MSDEKIIYLNGEYVPLHEAKVSVLDRGFLFADGIYEVIPVYNGKLFRLTEHLARAHHSLSQLYISAPVSDEQFGAIFQELLNRNSNHGPNQIIYCQITRGADVKRHHNIPTNLTPTLYVQCSPLPKHDHETLMLGKRAVVLEDIRWGHCDIKSIALLANVLLNHEAKQHDCEEAILIHEGTLTEGASSNVFIVKNGVIRTPPLSHRILGGITRDILIELTSQYNIPFQESQISQDELFAADEVWISSSTREIFPIVSLNDQPVGNGTVGPMWQAMIRHFHTYIQSL